MLTLETWKQIRETIDQALEYDPNPPIVVEKDGMTVIVSDSLPPEANAMALAMYSRSPKSFLVHLQEVLKKGWQKFMGQFYVGYGHKSIGDCGSTTVCTENVSMLVAKAVQDYKLYKGQEASTRYLDMANQRVLNPLGTPEGEDIQNLWMTLYKKVLAELIPYLTEKYPALPTDDPKVYEKAIKAKAFDIARAFLPAGCTTYVGWHTTLREAWDHLKELSFHPLLEVRESAQMMLSGLREKYPNSFNFKSYPEQDTFFEKCSVRTYHKPGTLSESVDWREGGSFSGWTEIDPGYMNQQTLDLLSTRPQKTELPDWFNKYGLFQFRFLLDFGSFRDLQRHRSCTQLMPLLTTKCGFNDWYLKSLPENLKTEVLETLAIQEERIAKIDDPLIRQYYIAMGYNVFCHVVAGLPSAVYIAELRSGQAVHPTLRRIAQKMANFLVRTIPEMALHVDYSGDEWSTARGKHDIVKKDE